MSWIVEGVMRSVYQSAGPFWADEWRACGRQLGVRFEVVPLRGDIVAFHVGTIIFLDVDLSPRDMAWWAWHELAHVLMHPGSIMAPIGDQLPEKQERQANEFAAIFPLWDGPPEILPTFAWDVGGRVVSWDGESERRFVGSLWGGGV